MVGMRQALRSNLKRVHSEIGDIVDLMAVKTDALDEKVAEVGRMAPVSDSVFEDVLAESRDILPRLLVARVPA